MARNHGKKIKEKRIKFVILFNFIITVAEVSGGLLSGSLALISDALHNFSDTIAIFISYVAYLLGKKEVTYKKTYGYKRAEILAALFNSTVLIVISFFLFKEAVVRLKSPTYINRPAVPTRMGYQKARRPVSPKLRRNVGGLIRG